MVKKVLLVVLLVVMMMVIFIPVAFAADVSMVGMASSLDDVAAVVLLAIVIEKVVNMIKAAINSAAPRPPGKPWELIWFAISSGIGILVSICFQVNILSSVGLSGTTQSSYIIGQVITGIAMGGGSGVVHDLIDRLKIGKATDKAYIEQSKNTPEDER